MVPASPRDLDGEAGNELTLEVEPCAGAPPHPLAETPARRERLITILSAVGRLPPAATGLEAYQQIVTVMNEHEDRWFGRDHWAPPRSFLDGRRTARLYPILPESFHRVPGYPGVTLLLARRELLFISRFGAIEFQDKLELDRYGEAVAFHCRQHLVIFEKHDVTGDGTWHPKNSL